MLVPPSAIARRVFASRGFLKTSPARGAWPSGSHVAAAWGVRERPRSEARQPPAMISLTGKPSSAYLIAYASVSEYGFVPNLVRSASQPLTQPGTDHESGPLLGMSW